MQEKERREEDNGGVTGTVAGGYGRCGFHYARRACVGIRGGVMAKRHHLSFGRPFTDLCAFNTATVLGCMDNVPGPSLPIPVVVCLLIPRNTGLHRSQLFVIFLVCVGGPDIAVP